MNIYDYMSENNIYTTNDLTMEDLKKFGVTENWSLGEINNLLDKLFNEVD